MGLNRDAHPTAFARQAVPQRIHPIGNAPVGAH